MNQIKSALTRLRNRVTEKISEEQDVLGFAGVTKADIVEYLNRAYGLVVRLETMRGTFAIVTLKRKIMPALEACKDSLDAATAESPDRAAFDQFLSGLTKVHDELYMTFVVYCSDGLNLAADISEIETSVANLRQEMSVLMPVAEEIKEALASLQENSEKSVEIVEEQEKSRTQTGTLIAEIEKAKTSALASAEVLTKYENNAKNEQDTINSLARKASKTDQHIKQVMAEVTEKTKLIDETLTKATDAASENDKQQREIQKTLEAASKYGMAASFKERKGELRLPMLLWSIVFLMAIAALFATGVLYIVPQIKNGEIPKPTDILIKLTLISPLIWLGWMAAKQYGYIARIREDYSFKYASALAFEGYKKEAIAVDATLLRDLLNVATSNMALNPLRIYSHDDNEASPVHDAFGKLLKRRGSSRTSKPSGNAAQDQPPLPEVE